MRKYEGLFILAPDAPEAKKNQLEAVEALVKKFNGKVTQKVELGKKSLGHAIKKNREGEFVVLDIELDPSHTDELRRALELQESLLKYMISVKNENITPIQASTKDKAPQKEAPASQQA